MTTEALLGVRGLRAGYGEVDIVQDVHLTIARGGFVSIIGPNGAGKSTLLKALYGLVPPRAGSVLFAGEHELAGLKPHRITALGMNYVPQLANVFPGMSVSENLEIGAIGARGGTAKRIQRMFDLFPMLHERRRQRAGTMSGGQRQMLALARALITDPKLLLLDEPSAGLAPKVVSEVFTKLKEINELGVAVLMVEQNARRSLAMSDYAYVLDLGRNRYEGPGRELLGDPKISELYLGGARGSAPPPISSTTNA
ncbi:MAG: ABC transporter ATP-binding protein [Solirubrobacteraceae bacterium]